MRDPSCRSQTRGLVRPVLHLLVALSLFVQAARPARPQAAASLEAVRRTLALYEQELAVVDLILDLRQRHRPADYELFNVRVVDAEAGRASSPACIEVRGGLVARVGECASEPGVQRIDGRGLWLLPGLADMHVHQLETSAAHLLHVANGVTTVRDMCGFPWLLEWRRQASADELFAPSMIVAGHILNASRMGMYATVVTTPAAARSAVREQAAAGYDAIKVHNNLPLEVYAAVADEARRTRLDLVGHVPHQITVRQALAAGHWTLEHLKGYIDDRNLQVRDDDSVPATRGATAWNAPTFYGYRQYLRGEAARGWYARDESRYVPLLRRERWRASIDAPLMDAHRDHLAKQQLVFRRLSAVTDRFLAGTDSGGGYPFMVPGFALHEELRLLQETGLSPPAALRATTTHAAAAARQSGRFGVIAPGARADLLLVAADPLEEVENLRRIEGVMLRGAWLDREDLDAALSRLAAIAGQTPAVTGGESALSASWVEGLVATVARQRSAGFVHPEHHLEELAQALTEAGFSSAAARLRRPAA